MNDSKLHLIKKFNNGGEFYKNYNKLIPKGDTGLVLVTKGSKYEIEPFLLGGKKWVLPKGAVDSGKGYYTLQRKKLFYDTKNNKFTFWDRDINPLKASGAKFYSDLYYDDNGNYYYPDGKGKLYNSDRRTDSGLRYGIGISKHNKSQIYIVNSNFFSNKKPIQDTKNPDTKQQVDSMATDKKQIAGKNPKETISTTGKQNPHTVNTDFQNAFNAARDAGQAAFSYNNQLFTTLKERQDNEDGKNDWTKSHNFSNWSTFKNLVDPNKNPLDETALNNYGKNPTATSTQVDTAQTKSSPSTTQNTAAQSKSTTATQPSNEPHQYNFNEDTIWNYANVQNIIDDYIKSITNPSYQRTENYIDYIHDRWDDYINKHANNLEDALKYVLAKEGGRGGIQGRDFRQMANSAAEWKRKKEEEYASSKIGKQNFSAPQQNSSSPQQDYSSSQQKSNPFQYILDLTNKITWKPSLWEDNQLS